MAPAEVDDGPTEVQSRIELNLSSRRVRPLLSWRDADGDHTLPTAVAPASNKSPPSTSAMPSVATDVPFKILREQWLDHLEREYIGALSRRGMNAPAIAEVAGLDRSYVLRLLRKHNL